MPETDIQTVCYHHEQSLIVSFSSHIKKCSDPFSLHLKGPVTKALKIVSLDFYSKTASIKGVLAPGEKLCISCKKQAMIKSEHNLLVQEFKDAKADTAEDILTAGPSGLCGETDTRASCSTISDVAPHLEAVISLHDTNAVLQILGEILVFHQLVDQKVVFRFDHCLLLAADTQLFTRSYYSLERCHFGIKIQT